MQFLMFVCKDTEPVAPPEHPGDIEEWVATNDASGARVLGDRIAPEHAAAVVRVRGGELLVTDGPYLETKEVLAGFDVLECADLAEAVRVAAAHPMAQTGVLELRPVVTD